jgi:hypothetical protein
MLENARHRRQLNRLIEHWIDFREIVTNPKSAKGSPQGRERRFLDLKGRIAEFLSLSTETYPGGMAQEAAINQKHMLDLMNRFQSLPEGDGTRDISAFERDWQRSFLFLNQLKGAHLSSRKKSFRAPVSAPSSRRNPLAAFLNFWLIKFILVMAVIVVALWTLASLLPWERMGLNPDLSGLRRAADSTVDRVRDADGPGGIVEFTRNFFSPVVAQYGTEVSIFLVTVLLLAVGYLFFIRSR